MQQLRMIRTLQLGRGDRSAISFESGLDCSVKTFGASDPPTLIDKMEVRAGECRVAG